MVKSDPNLTHCKRWELDEKQLQEIVVNQKVKVEVKNFDDGCLKAIVNAFNGRHVRNSGYSQLSLLGKHNKSNVKGELTNLEAVASKFEGMGRS